MDERSLAESLPELYREVLDRVASLELHGFRTEAGRIRSNATRVYSTAWNPAASKRLRTLRDHADRVLRGQVRPRTWRPWAGLMARWTPERSA